MLRPLKKSIILHRTLSHFEIFSYLHDKYGKNIETFVKVLGELKLVPDGIFMNDTMKRALLNPPATSPAASCD